MKKPVKSSGFGKRILRFLALLAVMAGEIAATEAAQGQPTLLLVDYVSSATLQTNFSRTVQLPTEPHPIIATDQTIAKTPKSLTSVERWDEFEPEFGIQEKDPAFVKGAIELAKYKVDETVFAAMELAERIRYDAYVKDFVTGSDSSTQPRRYYSDPLRDAWENAQIKSGVDWDAHAGHAFVGVKIVLPLGD